jgi:DNA-directed RNA polymerase subunit RPC12/RpoP
MGPNGGDVLDRLCSRENRWTIRYVIISEIYVWTEIDREMHGKRLCNVRANWLRAPRTLYVINKQSHMPWRNIFHLYAMGSFVYECVSCGHQLSGDEGASLSCPECRRLMKRIGRDSTGE